METIASEHRVEGTTQRCFFKAGTCPTGDVVATVFFECPQGFERGSGGCLYVVSVKANFVAREGGGAVAEFLPECHGSKVEHRCDDQRLLFSEVEKPMVELVDGKGEPVFPQGDWTLKMVPGRVGGSTKGSSNPGYGKEVAKLARSMKEELLVYSEACTRLFVKEVVEEAKEFAEGAEEMARRYEGALSERVGREALSVLTEATRISKEPSGSAPKARKKDPPTEPLGYFLELAFEGYLRQFLKDSERKVGARIEEDVRKILPSRGQASGPG